MNSKSHIFHHWNLELFKEVNPRIRTALQRFQMFWEEYDLAGRIRARMIKRNQIPQIAADTTRDVPDFQPRVHNDRLTTNVATKTTRRRKSQPVLEATSPHYSIGSSLPSSRSLPDKLKFDPGLFANKFHDHDNSNYPLCDDLFHPLEHSTLTHSSWRNQPPAHPRHSDSRSPGPYLHPALSAANVDFRSLQSGMARTNRHVTNAAACEANVSEIETKYEPSEDDGSFPSENATDIVEDAKQEEFRPKGLQFDGMGGFDAASNAQKRKRNQRKDPEVLVQLRANSEMVTTDEHVFDINFNLQRVRDVFDESDISVDEDNDTSATKRRKKQSSSARVTKSTRKGRKRPTKLADEQVVPPSTARVKRASARAAQVAITKLHQPRSDPLTMAKSPSVSRPSSAHSATNSNHQLSVLETHNRRATSGVGKSPLALSSSGINSRGGRVGGDAQGSSHHRLSSNLSHDMYTMQASESIPLKFSAPGEPPFGFPLTNAEKENDPRAFYAGHMSVNPNPYFSAQEARDPATYNPLYVQRVGSDRAAMVSHYNEPTRPDEFALHQMQRNAPFPLMQLPQHDGLVHHHHIAPSDHQF
ncbi:uncharacterized protein B0I36DRAFT_381655 [Microdochium trichocladiopsis]|uniref:Uncharacterized protein n=1 Tax=Microdochium trichocladiopsis TaxID=1682393 RepID=A0A9P9BSH4_9PEZI|nr:uncharacterized protein B0I36DRAFT_381655 [Microdochium trichocladiopsis]KAH7034800.1 hypothetical protein B0I36DRAFT_381655 [Microdochium trichocladiopsis]